MFTQVRGKMGTIVTGGIIGFIAFVFIFSGVFSPRATRGLHEGAVAGKVNGESITLDEFNREFNRRVEFFKNMAGGKLTEEQIQAFRLRDMVFKDLVRRKVELQEAYRLGLAASDEQVKAAILDIPAFKKDGKFDLLTYKAVLQANNYSPSSFERVMRDDLSGQLWEEYFRRRAFVSEEEAKREFIQNRDRRKIRYVLITLDAGKKLVPVSADDVAKYLGDKAKNNLAQAQFNAQKDSTYKGKTFDAVKEGIARDLIASERLTEVQAAVDRLATQVQGVLTADASSNAKVNALLKPTGVEVKSSEWITRQGGMVPGIGDAAPLVKDLFSPKGLLDPAQGGKVAKYSLVIGTVVAVQSGAEKPDLAQFAKEREQILRQMTNRKQRELHQAWSADLTKKASVDPNPAVISDSSS